MRFHTIGHSTHPIETFLELLSQHQVAELVDVRSYPSSKRWPQFNQEVLRQTLELAGIKYHWLKSLGGRRRGGNESVNDGWEHPAFRAYADHLASVEGQLALNDLTEISISLPSAVMCSEGLWWQCHRRIISDYMVVRGWELAHIMPDGRLAPHRMTPFAQVCNDIIEYRAPGRQ
jgi:uncharacterized protein (DUF488 family)